MSISEIKQEIKSEIDKINDERLLAEIQWLLHRDEGGIPQWHKQILEERLKEIESGDS